MITHIDLLQELNRLFWDSGGEIYQVELERRVQPVALIDNNVTREKVADLYHSQWSGWMTYLFSKGIFNKNGTWTMPAEFAERLKRQMNTSYEELPEQEKDSDRIEADKFISLLGQWY